MEVQRMKKIGQEFLIKIKAVAVKAKGRGCESCVLSGADCASYPCMADERADGEDVVYRDAMYKDAES